MKLTTILTFGASAHSVAGHYFFGDFILNGKRTERFEYIRPISGRPQAYPEPFVFIFPLMDPSHIDMRCGRNASTLQYPIEMAQIKAGDTVGFGVSHVALEQTNGEVFHSDVIIHAGFASAWLSRVPDEMNIEDYKGDGEWVKFLMVANRTEQSIDFNDPRYKRYENEVYAQWGAFRLDSYNFTIPRTTPAGRYLLRWEHMYNLPSSIDGGTQFYINCAHVEIANDGAQAVPGPSVKIPGHYVKDQPDVYFESFTTSPANVVPPKPDVWHGGDGGVDEI